MTAMRKPVPIPGLHKLNHHALQKLNARYMTGYRFADKEKDLICDQLAQLIDEAGATPHQISRQGNVAWGTVQAIISGKTRRPQNRTVEAVLRGLGLTRQIVRFKIGVVQ